MENFGKEPFSGKHFRGQPWHMGGDVSVPPQDKASVLLSRNAHDTGAADHGSIGSLSLPVIIMTVPNVKVMLRRSPLTTY